MIVQLISVQFREQKILVENRRMLKLPPLKKVKVEWAGKTPKQKWSAFYNTGMFMADLDHTKKEENKIGWIGYYPIFHGVGYIGLAIYSIFFYINRNQFTECIKIFCFFGILIQVSKINNKSIFFDNENEPFPFSPRNHVHDNDK